MFKTLCEAVDVAQVGRVSTVHEALGSIPSTPELDVLVHAVVLALGRQRHSIRSSRSSVAMQPVRGQPGLHETLSQTSTPKPRTSNTKPSVT